MERIEPEHFDVIVLGSGLPEALFASALAKAGSSVLLVDSSDFYGGSWSSLSWDSFQSILQAGASVNDAAPTLSTEAGCSVVQPASAVHILSRQTYVSDHSIQHESKFFIIDLNPKVLYQGEVLVHAMIRSSVHNYIEFKMMEGSYIYQNSALKPVPASKSDVFRTRDLTLLEKRALMQFLTSFLARPSDGALEPPGPTPGSLAKLLAAAKLSPQLQAAVLYGIAMADSPRASYASPPSGPDQQDGEQQQQRQPQQEQGPCQEQEQQHFPPPPLQGVQQQDQEQQQQQQQQQQQREQTAECPAGVLSAEEGRGAMQLYMASLGLYGGKSPFMLPLYGGGSIVEGYIRAAAVGGAVTVLRQPLKGLALEAGGDGGGRGRCKGLLTEQGQLLECEQLVAAAPLLRTLLPPSAPPSHQRVISRAVAILDKPLEPGHSSMAVVFPPGGAGSNPGVIRALQLGSTTCVAQSGRFLLYLVAEAGSCSAAADLMPALSALAYTLHLRPLSTPQAPPSVSASSTPGATQQPPPPAPQCPPSSTAEGATAADAAGPPEDSAASTAGDGCVAVARTAPEQCGSAGEVPASGGSCGDGAGPHVEAAGRAGGAAAASGATGAAAVVPPSQSPSAAAAAAATQRKRPKVLHVEFYQQEVVGEVGEEQLPVNVVCCPDACPFTLGFTASFQRCQAVFSRHFPGVRWVPAAAEQGVAQGAGSEEDDELAMEDLRSAVGQIAASQTPQG